MTALDLAAAPPREPRAQLAGITFLPRSLDKIRATLPDGVLGAYAIEGFTVMMLDMLEISLADVTAEIARATDEADVARYVLAHSSAKQRARWETFILAREPRGGNRQQALEVYPWLASRPELILAVDVLAEDDRQAFPPA